MWQPAPNEVSTYRDATNTSGTNLRAISFFILVLLGTSCRVNHIAAGSEVRIVPTQVPVGTPVATNKLPHAPSRVVLMVVSDCQNCSAQILKLAHHKNEVTRYIVTVDPTLVKSLRREWRGLMVVPDPQCIILPKYCYYITPQTFLVRGGRIVDEAIGAIECESKWDEWNK